MRLTRMSGAAIEGDANVVTAGNGHQHTLKGVGKRHKSLMYNAKPLARIRLVAARDGYQRVR
jgi:hypothetical protein